MEAGHHLDAIASTSQVVPKQEIKTEVCDPEDGKEHDDGFHISVKMEVETMDECDFTEEFAHQAEGQLGDDMFTTAIQQYNKVNLHTVEIKTEVSADDESDAEMQMVIDEEALEFSRIAKDTPGPAREERLRSCEARDGDDYEGILQQMAASSEGTYYQCALCVQIYNSKELFRKHLSAWHSREGLVLARSLRDGLTEVTARAPAHLSTFVAHTRYRVLVHACTSCAEEFATRALLQRHAALRHGSDGGDRDSGFSECAMCGCSFLTEEECDGHRCQVECKKCRREFASCRGLVEHALALVPLRIACPCGWVGAGPNIQRHKYRCDKLLLQCTHCSATFNSLRSLKGHIDNHVDRVVNTAKKRLPLCRYCKKKYSGPYKLHNCPARSPRYYCKCCDAGFSTRTLRDLHLHDNRSPQPWSCDRCSMQLELLCGRALHDKHYHGAMFPCFPCQLSFDREPDFNTHMAREHGKGVKKWCARCDEEFFEMEDHVCDKGKCRFVCERCSERFWTRQSLDVHDAPKPKHCPRCKATFESKCAMNQHECPYKCSACDANISSLAELASRTCANCKGETEHVNVTRNLYFFCKFCVTGFPTKELLEHHGEVNVGKLAKPCRICGKTFLRFCASDAHRCVETDIPTRKFMCRLCECSLDDLAQLRAHEREAHAGVDIAAAIAVCGACREQYVGEHECTRRSCRYSCPHCKLRFRWIALLNTHDGLNRLEEGPDSACASCGAELQSECYRRLHSCGEVHTCTVCQKGFVTKEFLVAHTLKHHVDVVVSMNANELAQGGFECPVCFEVLSSEYFLNSHVRSKHKDLHDKSIVGGRRISFKCPKCLIVFDSKWGLDSHFRLNHTEEAAKCEMLRVCKTTPPIAIKKQTNVRTYGKRAATTDTKVFKSSLDKVFRVGYPAVEIKQEVKEEPKELLESLESVEVVEVTAETVKAEPETEEREEAEAVQCIEDFIANTDEIVLSTDDSQEEAGEERAEESSSVYTCKRCHRHSAVIGRYVRHYRSHGLAPLQCPACAATLAAKAFVPHLLEHAADNYGCSVSILEKTNHCAVANQRGHYTCGTCKRRVHYSQMFEHWERHELAGLPVSVADTTRQPLNRRQLVRTQQPAVCERARPLRIQHVVGTSGPLKPGRLNATELSGVLSRLVERKKHSTGCSLCERTFCRMSDRKRHLIEHIVRHAYAADDFDGRFTCDMCGLQTAILATYKQHLRDHANLRLYQCQLCDKSFSDSSNFSKHKKVHGLMYMECDLCRRRFTSKPMLEQHMEFHSTAAVMPCPHCPRVFYFKSSFKRHARTHGDRRHPTNFRCSICRKPFASMKLKWEHQWVAHGKRAVSADCALCPARFRNKQQLRGHQRHAHRDQFAARIKGTVKVKSEYDLRNHCTDKL